MSALSPSDPDSTTSANFITIPPGILILLIIKNVQLGKIGSDRYDEELHIFEVSVYFIFCTFS
jgi:hypothetical protein